MKNTTLFIILLLQSVTVVSQVPLPFQKRVKPMPETYERPSESTNLMKDGGKTKSPWIVFSDRDENITTTVPGGSLVMKKLAFMESFYVTKEKDGFLKLIKYNTGMLNGRKINDKRNAVSYGWIHRSKLLLWNKSMLNPQSGFAQKSIAIINGRLPLTASPFYYDRTDSAYVYSSPELKKIIAKVRLHEINYIFKRSADRRAYLIGNENQLVTDSARKSIFGWLAADAEHQWGERLFISPATISSDIQADSASMLLHQVHADPLLNSSNVILRSSPVITVPSSHSSAQSITGLSAGSTYVIGQATDVFDKSHNSLITINGANLMYPDYLVLRKNIRKINVVFVIDGGSSMNKYFAGLTNTIQSFENVFNSYGKSYEMNYGAVVYRNDNNCMAPGIVSTNAISPDFRKLMSFLGTEAGKTQQCSKIISSQPVFQGLHAAMDLLKTHPHETNLVVVLGSTGDASVMPDSLSKEFGGMDARLLAIQVYSEYHVIFNNFVLQFKKMVLESAAHSAEIKKGYLINGEGLNTSQTYNVSQVDSLPFYLDYPNNSLIQGGVVFPTKGAVSSSKSMTIAVKRFLKETDFDIQHQITSLDSAFRLRGIANANLSVPVKMQLGTDIGSELADQMPHNAFKYYITSTVPADIVAQHKDQLQYAIVLNTSEFSELSDVLYTMTGRNLEPDQPSFRRKLLKNYFNIPRTYLHTGLSRGTIKSMTLAQYLKTATGLPLDHQLLKTYKVADLRSESKMPLPEFEKYIKFLISADDRIKQATQVGQQFISNGKTYYYLTENNFGVNP
jgi:hypothetical protein